jgi:tetratricopeptide (TPR) repeat protein
MRAPAALTTRVRARLRPVALCAALTLAAGVAHAAGGATGPTRDELSDLEAKAQFAFFTDDLSTLRSLTRANRALASSADPLELYHFAHVEFRLLQVALRARQPKEAEAAGEACVAALDRAVEADPRFAEALALEADCYGYLSTLGPVKAVLAGPKSAARAESAARLNPRSPRVLLSEAVGLWFRPAAFGGDRVKAAPLFLKAAEAFDAIDAPRPGEPTWGAAEAWLFVGRAAESRGDILAARNAYEKSLLVAPEFAAAKKHLAALPRR